MFECRFWLLDIQQPESAFKPSTFIEKTTDYFQNLLDLSPK